MAADRATRGLPSGNPSRHLIFLGRPGHRKGDRRRADRRHLRRAEPPRLGAPRRLQRASTSPAATRGAEGRGARSTGPSAASCSSRMPTCSTGMSVAVAELSRLMAERRDKFMVVCASLPDEMEGFLLANPGFRAEFGAIVEFREPTDRQLVRAVLPAGRARPVHAGRGAAGRAARPVRRHAAGTPGSRSPTPYAALFDQIVARQAARLAGRARQRRGRGPAERP